MCPMRPLKFLFSCKQSQKVGESMDVFERYPDVLIVADSTDSVYKIKYLERILENGVVRFERREKKVLREKLEIIIQEMIENG